MKNREQRRKLIKTPWFFVALLSFLIIILLVIYIIYLRFIPYMTIEYDGYAVSGKDIATNLLNSTFDVETSIKALEVKDQDSIYKNLNSYYIGASKDENINLDYPIYINNSLAAYNLSSDVTLITDEFEQIEGYSGITLTSGALYNSNTLQRADYYDYILMKNKDNLYINAKDITVKTTFNEYTIPMNSIINFTSSFITYYTLKDGDFVYGKIIDVDENSHIIIKDYNKDYTYKQFLIGLKIIRDNTKPAKPENNEVNNEEAKPEENVIQNVEAPAPEPEPEQKPDDNYTGGTAEVKWIAPTVESTYFTANVYTSYAEVSITDPSRVMKAVTYAFYKNGDLAFRTSTTKSGAVSVNKLLPSTTYTIVAKYQYRNKQGSLLENTLYTQEITTKGIDTLNTIDLSFEKGKVYSDKIEIKNIRIASDLTDEAIYGISRAEIWIDGSSYSISTGVLKSIVNGGSTDYVSPAGLKSNSSHNYEFKFYDTAGNQMKLTNYTGTAVTSRKSPSTKITPNAQDVTKVTIGINLINEDNVPMDNYRYVLYSSTGEVKYRDSITGNNAKLEFDDLDPENTYTIRIFADFDISDGNGYQRDREIGTATFTTLSLSKLGSLKIDLEYDEDNDLTSNSINLKVGINTEKTDQRLIAILKNVTLIIKDKKNNEITRNVMDDIDALSSDTGITNLIQNLQSNTEYRIELSAVAKQGSVEKEISVSYTVNSFITNKKPATFNVRNVVVTTNLIDMDILVEDPDDACAQSITTIRLMDKFEKEYMPTIEVLDKNAEEVKDNKKIPTNMWVRLTYTGLSKDEKYNLTCEAASYNETHDDKKVQGPYKIGGQELITSGLEGKVSLIGLERQKAEIGKNLVDVTSENNWYSQVFDSLYADYEFNEAGTDVNFVTKSKYHYERTYNEASNELTMMVNQCYVYNLKAYAGKTVTMSFKAQWQWIDNKKPVAEPEIYVQLGKEMGANIQKIEGINNTSWASYQVTVTVPADGFVGFYLKEYKQMEEIKAAVVDKDTGEILIPAEEKEFIRDYKFHVRDLQIEEGKNATAYEKYNYIFHANIEESFLDVNHVTFEEEANTCRYYIRITSVDENNNKNVTEYPYDYNSDEIMKELRQYTIAESQGKVQYTVQLIIKQFEREYVLSQTEFTYDSEDRTEIKSISNLTEFLEIQPEGNYILLNDINLVNGGSESAYTFGSPEITFNGTIDFNGKTVSKDTFVTSRQMEVTPYIFYKIGTNATLKNLVLDFAINSNVSKMTKTVIGDRGTRTVETVAEDGYYGLFLYNEGSIDNLVLKLTGSTQYERQYIGLVGYDNSGTIENFIIEYDVPLYVTKYAAGVVLYSHNKIQNGYIFGQGIETYGDVAEYDYRYIGGVAFQLDHDTGLIQNIYNITQIKINHTPRTYSYAANIVYELGYPPVYGTNGQITSRPSCGARVRNVYSVMSILTVDENGEEHNCLLDTNEPPEEKYIGPNIFEKNEGTRALDCYYFCDVMYDDTDYNTKTAATALYEPGVQDVMLNANDYNQFIVDTFVSNGYYPHLKMNYCMPEQVNTRITIKGTEIIDILSGEAIENNDISKLDLSAKVRTEINNYIASNKVDLTDENIKLVAVRVYNPAGTTITKIKVNYLESVILSQAYSKRVSTVYILLQNPTSFLDQYDVSRIESKQANGTIKFNEYGENKDSGTRTIEVRFVKKIRSDADWAKISQDDENGVSGLIQNYRLATDIDFADSYYSPYVTGTFTGYLDGEFEGTVHTLKNISGTQPVFAGFSEGTIKNINVDGLTINTDAQRTGFIAYANIEENIVIDNINIKDLEINTTYGGDYPRYGGIVGELYSGPYNKVDSMLVQNCSIQNFDLTFSNSNIQHVVAGGIVGYMYAYGGVDTYVQNSYVYNFNVEAANVISVSGIGGIVGYKTHNNDINVKNGYAKFYIQNCYTTGRINTLSHAGGILGFGQFGDCYIKYCFSLINLNTKTTSGAVYFGGIAGYSDSGAAGVQNCMYLGNIYMAGSDNMLSNYARILGNNHSTSNYNNYAYADQLMSGEKKTNSWGATKLLKDEEIFSDNTFDNLLKFDDNYARTVQVNGSTINLIASRYFPQLMKTDKTGLVANQKLLTLDNDLKLYSITTTLAADQTSATVEMKFENPNNLQLLDVTIEENDMSVVPGSWQTSKEAGTGLTIAKFVATPNKAYESYKIENIIYTRDGITNVSKEISTKIKATLYKSISTADEWNDFFGPNGTGKVYTGQNVRITGNLDFSGKTATTDVIIGRFQSDAGASIANLNITVGANSGLIKEVKTTCANITVRNSTITTTGDYSGLISILRAQMSNCTFDNVTINANNHSYVGIVSRTISGSFSGITLNKITINSAGSLVGTLCGQTTSLGSSSSITGTYIKVTAGGNYIGGIFGQTQNSISKVYVYQYSKNGMQAGDTDTGYLVKGGAIVGGAIGEYNGSGSWLNTVEVTNSVIMGTGNYVGANCGNGSSTTTNMVSRNNVILGAGIVGGNNGQKGGWTGSNLTSENNIIIATNNLTLCSNREEYKNKPVTGNNVGGNNGYSGWTTNYNLTSKNNYIRGIDYVGGNIGQVNYYNTSCENFVSGGTDQLISGRNCVGGSIGWTNARAKILNVSDCQITATGNYVGGAIGHSEYTNTAISNSDNYTVRGVRVSNVTLRGVSYVGGAVGNQRGTIYGAAVINGTTVTGTGTYVGGITGYYTGYTGTNSSYLRSDGYYLWHSYIENSTVQGDTKVGGITGVLEIGNLQFCNVINTSVTATSATAGGIVGYYQNNKLNSIQYKATIKDNIIMNTQDGIRVTSKEYAGGLIGAANKPIKYDGNYRFSNIECNLIVTDVYATTGSHADMGVSYIETNGEYGMMQAVYMNNTFVYNGNVLSCSLLDAPTQIAGIYDYTVRDTLPIVTDDDDLDKTKARYMLITSDELSKVVTYTMNKVIYEKKYAFIPIKDEETGEPTGEYKKVYVRSVGVATEGLNFGSSHYEYQAGYLPKLKTSQSADLYWSNLGITTNYVAVPNRTIEFTSPTVYLYDTYALSYDDNNIETLAMSASIMPVAYFDEDDDSIPIEDLPNMYVYPVDVNKINVEFSNISGNASFAISSNGEIISEKQNIKQRVYTFEYDFNTPITIKVLNSNYWETKEFSANELKNMLSITGDEYFYLREGKLNSNKKQIEGNFVNLYNNKVLDIDGNIFDITTMTQTGSANKGIKQLSELTPIAEADVSGKNVQTFYHCSKVTSQDGTSIYKDGQIFVKKGKLYVIDGNISSVGTSVIIDTNNGKQYEATLGTDGTIYNLLTQIKYPEKFKNEKIVQMTNNVNSNSTAVLIYSSNGNVYGFDYLTGEELYDNGVNEDASTNFISYLFKNLNEEKIAYKTSKEDYEKAQELIQKLEKKSIDDATTDISGNTTVEIDMSADGNSTDISNIDINTNNTGTSVDIPDKGTQNSGNSNMGYIASYDASNQDYVVYSEDEILDTSTSKLTTENAKINKNPELINYYNNLSVGKKGIQNIGTILIIVIVIAIIGALIVMYKKSNK